MAEFWKSTERYWCKHCSCYVRDTKLERQNHESTAKHQGALKRFLRDLHRGHEREERDKERAQREIARLNGVVPGTSSATTSKPGFGGPTQPTTSAPTGLSSEAELKKQREQLAELGISIPTAYRPEMAIPGEWTVTSTRVIEKKKDNEGKVEAKASGVRKREVTEDEKEEEEAVKGLFKKPRRWGRDSKAAHQEEDAELDALLSGSMLSRKPVKDEDIKDEDAVDAKEEVKRGFKFEMAQGADMIKNEPEDDAQGVSAPDKNDVPDLGAPVKTEEEDGGVAPVVFKKRKPKTIRQK